MADLAAKEYWVYPKSRADLSHLKTLDMPLKIGICCERWNKIFRENAEQGFNRSPHFTTGFAAIVMALEWLKPQRLWLAGFDNLWNPRKMYENVLKEWMGYTPHDLEVEHMMLPMLERHYNTEILPF